MTPQNASIFFLRLYDRMRANRAVVLAATSMLVLVAAIPLIEVRLDMSLQAFNSDDPADMATATK